MIHTQHESCNCQLMKFFNSYFFVSFDFFEYLNKVLDNSNQVSGREDNWRVILCVRVCKSHCCRSLRLILQLLST